jgi:hypothetical protein
LKVEWHSVQFTQTLRIVMFGHEKFRSTSFSSDSLLHSALVRMEGFVFRCSAISAMSCERFIFESRSESARCYVTVSWC